MIRHPLLALLLAVPAVSQAVPKHPLDPLEEAEVKVAMRALRSAGKVDDSTLFPYVLLREPAKKDVLAFRPGKPFRREALAVAYDRKSSSTTEFTVDLRTGRIAGEKRIPGVQPSVMLSEFEAAPAIVKADPSFLEALKRRGISSPDDVAVDVWGYGTPDSDRSRSARLLRAIAYFKGKGKNFYARPIEGLTFIVDMDQRKVERVIDTETYPVPPVASELDPKGIGKARPRLKPLRVSQPQGPSFRVSGREVRWDNWSFRFDMHPREGLVLYLARYKDRGRERPVLYRASLSEMMVPYGHPDRHWTWRAAFDEGEYGIGRYSGSLERGTDVPEHARMFDAMFVGDFGKPYVAKDAVALYERDGGLLWKHFDMYNGGNHSRRGRQLVLGFITTVSNYDYGINWVFHEDGTLELETLLSGIMLTKGSTLATLPSHAEGGHDSPDLRYGHLVAPNVVAPHHQHFFNFRIDLDVDGERNSAAELGIAPVESREENPAGNAFTMTRSLLASEKGAMRDLSFEAQRKWLVFNPEARNALGYETGYLLIPGENAAPYLRADSPLRRRGGFVNHQVWLTQHRDDELYAAGKYPSQRDSADGLSEWVKQDRPLRSQDLVLWYTYCATHAPRPEEWPVMNVTKLGFKLVPAGFFDRNPALDVAR